MADMKPFTNERNTSMSSDKGKGETAQQSLAEFHELYITWLPPVYRYFYYRVMNAKDAEDLTAQVFLKVYEELSNYRNHGQFPAWLFTIARHKAADFFRKRHPSISLEMTDPIDKALDLQAQVIQTDEIQRLRQLIRTLPEEEQELIRLRFVAALGYREIGLVLHRKEDAVRKSISRLLIRLQNQLEEKND